MCHQTIEKALKAVIARDCAEGEIPPKIHHLLKPADRGGLFQRMSADHQTFLKELNPLNIEAHLLDTKHDKSGFVQHVFKTGRIIYQA